jgi:ParB family chromosome partitioning protein
VSDHTKTWSEVLGAVRAHHTGLIAVGDVDEEELRLTIANAQVRKQKVIARKLENPQLSTRELAEEFNVGQSTVVRDLSEPNSSAIEPNGSSSSTRALLSQSDQNDWRTPRKFLDAARAVMGAIDLDPATSEEANETVDAARFYTESDDGLTKPWKGRVWLNPPYGGKARLFIERLVKEYEVGNVTAACALLNSHPTETKWFQRLFDYSLCFVHGRIDFGGPSREVSSTSTHGSAIAYLGNDLPKFRDVFSQFGAVVRKI